MQSPKPLDKNIQFLIMANYRRMVSFEQAAFLTNESSFKEFYLDKAEESEINIKQLYLMLNVQQPETEETEIASMPNIFQGKKNTIKILEAVKVVEKTVAKWYKTTLQEIKDLPVEMVNIVQDQYRLLNNAQLQLEHL